MGQLPEVVTYFDAAGRTLREESQGFSPSQRIAVDTIYDTAGRVAQRSLPYSSGAPAYIVYHHDERGRVWKTENPDGSHVQRNFQQKADRLETTTTEKIAGAGGTRYFYRLSSAIRGWCIAGI